MGRAVCFYVPPRFGPDAVNIYAKVWDNLSQSGKEHFMAEKYDPVQAAELAAAQNATMLFNTLFAPSESPEEKPLDKVKEPPHPTRSREREER